MPLNKKSVTVFVSKRKHLTHPKSIQIKEKNAYKIVLKESTFNSLH